MAKSKIIRRLRIPAVTVATCAALVAATSGAAQAAPSPVIGYGATGTGVTCVQQVLYQAFLNGRVSREAYPDGIYGPWTKEAVEEYQVSYGLKKDGIVGVSTGDFMIGDEETAGMDGWVDVCKDYIPNNLISA